LTVVHGNVSLQQGIENAKTLVKVLKAQARIAIYGGCSSSLVADKDEVIPYAGHGKDGLGNHQKHYYFEVLKSEPDVVPNKEHAVVALCRLAREFKGELQVHAIGPLT
jgi:inosine-uridine nucleoside N-ribohydrolase